MSNTALKAALEAGAKQTSGAASAGTRLIADSGRKAAEWAVANPGKTAAVGAGAVLLAVPMVAAAPLLGAVGFGANGVAAGSLAAATQSSIGSVVGPSVFATLQSAGAGGYGVVQVSTAFQGLGAAVASTGILSAFRKTNTPDAGDETVGPDEAKENENGPGKDGDDGDTASKL